MAGAAGNRVSLPNSRIMIHAGSAGFPRSSIPDLEVMSKEFLKVRDIMEELYTRHTGQPLEKLRRDMERDNFMNPEEARAYNLIDKVVEPKKLPTIKGR
jgi:ATP-dependent Clp protease, protease subunit